MSRKLTTAEFIARAKATHGDRYNYDNVDYKTNNSKVAIICHKHGKFWQSLIHHVYARQGCPECSGSKKLTTDVFIKKARKVHGGKYDYGKVKYIDANHGVIIICPKHGEFLQRPACHINSRRQGCPKCAGVSPLTTEQFVKKAVQVHGAKYDYSKTQYSGAHKKTAIICPTHGCFLQEPANHIDRRSGCPECRKSKGELSIARILDANGIDYIKQKRFPECVNPSTNHKMPFDFYLPKQNMLIEYNGEQHYMVAKCWHKNGKTLESQQNRDAIKQDYAVKHGFEYLIIKYDNKNIEQALQKVVA